MYLLGTCMGHSCFTKPFVFSGWSFWPSRKGMLGWHGAHNIRCSERTLWSFFHLARTKTSTVIEVVWNHSHAMNEWSLKITIPFINSHDTWENTWSNMEDHSASLISFLQPTNVRKGCDLKERQMNNDWNVILQKHMITCHTWRCWCVLIGNSFIVSIHPAVFYHIKHLKSSASNGDDSPNPFTWNTWRMVADRFGRDDSLWPTCSPDIRGRMRFRIYWDISWQITETRWCFIQFNILYIYIIIYYPCLEMFTVMALLWPFTSYKYWITVTPMYNPIERTSQL